MKRIVWFALALVVALGAMQPVEAKKQEDQEFRRVIVTLKSGEKIDGYLTAMWTPDRGLKLKKPNYSFKLALTPDGKRSDSAKYTADEVASIDYTEASEEYPDGIRWESHPVASPSIGNRYHTNNMFVCKDVSSEHATVYWYKAWVTEQTGNITKRVLKIFYCLRFHDDPDQIVYPYQLLNTVLLKDKKPGLKEHIKGWFKGEEKKARKKQSKDEYAWILDCYEDYLRTRE